MTFEQWWRESEKVNDLGVNTALNSRLEAVATRAWNAALRAASEEMLRCCCSHPRHEHNLTSGKCEHKDCDCMNLCDCWAVVAETRESELPGVLAKVFDRITQKS